MVEASVERFALAASFTTEGRVLAPKAFENARVRDSSFSRLVAVYCATSQASLKRVA